jgi:hypothetical protein
MTLAMSAGNAKAREDSPTGATEGSGVVRVEIRQVAGGIDELPRKRDGRPAFAKEVRHAHAHSGDFL